MTRDYQEALAAYANAIRIAEMYAAEGNDREYLRWMDQAEIRMQHAMRRK